MRNNQQLIAVALLAVKANTAAELTVLRMKAEDTGIIELDIGMEAIANGSVAALVVVNGRHSDEQRRSVTLAYVHIVDAV